jgi:hypothetical protein
LACTAGIPVNSRTGKETKLPPPATAFSVPAIAAAKKRRMAWLKGKLIFLSGKWRPEKRVRVIPHSAFEKSSTGSISSREAA